ncbi:hypothetical protein PVL29_017774 [Vitis rotundifolia]|uniref:Receptor-like serine/threonine-protein kinase n=1 Tax=Vitis rotundifolia TaxID=103349 RepID=A0AA39DI84_VITRO|nr:hypothetical protein PVL29_017774 [Vitis rotundifolia]
MAFPMLHHAVLLLLFVLPSWPSVFSRANPEIRLGSSLIASDNSSSWRSPSGEFAFGFYQLGNQNLFLLAIWFDKIPEKTLAWYANGDNPAPEGSKVELTSDGQLILNDPRGDEIWRPQTTLNGVTHAYMLDAGNFVLVNEDQNSTRVWESFKNPADTVLPTQVLEIGGTVSSRQAESNYSKGRFQLRLLPDGNLVLNTFDLQTNTAYDAYYWSHTYDAANKSNSGERVIFDESGRLYVVLQSGENVILKSGSAGPTGGYYYRATLDFDGVYRLYTRSKLQNNGSWVPLGGGSCGFNSYCVLTKVEGPACECLPGFFPVDPDNKLDGCKHNLTQKCEAGGSNQRIYTKSVRCRTYFGLILQTLKMAVHNEGTCWKKKMPLSNGRANWSIQGKTMIKVPKYDASSGMPPFQDPIRGKKKDQGTLILVGSILLGSSVFLNFLLAALISLVRSSSSQKGHKLLRSSSILETNIRSFTFEELKQATDGFREELGRGAFGTVYKGILSSRSSETQVAVKKLDKLGQEGEREFKSEVRTIAMTHHKNLVRLIGLCDEGPHKLLVYEFMCNGTLASFLFGSSAADWKIRTQMAFGIARGLMYLHEECSTQIIHCDIKPQNVLLDDSFTARISDFGLAKLLMSDQTRTLTAIRGTKGYVAPEWFRSKPITAKVDVYSYGVMLLEIISCRRCIDFQTENEEEAILTDWAYDCYRGHRLDKLVENDDDARNDMRRLEKLVMVAIWCIQEDPSLRPSMRNVTQMLEGVVEVPMPSCPFPSTSIR